MSLWNDIRYGFGQMRRTPLATSAAILAIGVAIGSCSTMFTTVDAYLWKTPPFPNGPRLVAFHERDSASADFMRFSFSPLVFARWREASTRLERISGFSYESGALGTGQGKEPVYHTRVSADFFLALGTATALGRVLTQDDDKSGAAKVAVISDGIWKRNFASDPNVTSQVLDLNGARYQIAGVMPRGFGYPYATDVWTPLALDAAGRTSLNGRLLGLALLRPGSTMELASEELRKISERLAVEHPKEQGNRTPVLGGFRDINNGALTKRYSMLGLWGCLFVLLIACVNVANLQFAQTSGRRAEISTRMALGASPGEILRLLMVQSVLITFCGGAIGWMLAHWWLDLVRAGMPAEVARFVLGWYEIELDYRALGFTILLASISGVLAGLLPALKAGGWNVAFNLRDAGRSGTGGRGSNHARSILVVAQLALVILLLTGAGLMVKGFAALVNQSKALAPDQALYAKLTLPDKLKPEATRELYRRLGEQVESRHPGTAVAFADAAPFTNRRLISPFRWNGEDAEVTRRTAGITFATPSFLPMAGGRLVAGRWFDSTDGAHTPAVVVASESFAKRYGGGREILGRELWLGEESQPVRIVGVVSDIPWDSFKIFGTALYRPFVQRSFHSADILVRLPGTADPIQLVPTVRHALRALEPEAMLGSPRTMSIVIRDERTGLTYITAMLGILGLIALLLSAVGVYALVAFTVTERMREFGVRMALGATPSGLARLVMGGGLKLALIGIAIGVPASWFLTQAISGLLQGVEAHDPAVFGGTIAGLLALVLLASYGPARRAAGMSPNSVLNR